MNKHEVFIDGSNFFTTTRALNISVDYMRLRSFLRGMGVTRINYFTAVYEDEENFRKLQPMIDWLMYNGYNVVTKPAKEHINIAGKSHIKGNMDVEIAVWAMEASEYCDRITLFTGDGDFVELVKSLQRKGMHVTIVSSIETEPSTISDELRRQADDYMDVADIAYSIVKLQEEKE